MLWRGYKLRTWNMLNNLDFFGYLNICPAPFAMDFLDLLVNLSKIG
jgi:hypothetical protein